MVNLNTQITSNKSVEESVWVTLRHINEDMNRFMSLTFGHMCSYLRPNLFSTVLRKANKNRYREGNLPDPQKQQPLPCQPAFCYCSLCDENIHFCFPPLSPVNSNHSCQTVYVLHASGSQTPPARSSSPFSHSVALFISEHGKTLQIKWQLTSKARRWRWRDGQNIWFILCQCWRGQTQIYAVNREWLERSGEDRAVSTDPWRRETQTKQSQIWTENDEKVVCSQTDSSLLSAKALHNLFHFCDLMYSVRKESRT